MKCAAGPYAWTCLLFGILWAASICGCSCGDDDDDSGGGDDDASDDDDDDDAADDDAVDDDSDDDATGGPTVVDISPPDGAKDQRLLTVVTVTFSEAMDAASVEDLFDTGSVAGSFSWDASGEILTFTPDEALDEETTYNFALGAGALAQDGDAMAADETFAFTTVDLWTRTWNSDAGDIDRGLGLAVDAANGALVAGITMSDTESQNMLYQLWNASGNNVWSYGHDGGYEGYDAGWAIAPTDDGGFVVAGDITDSSGDNFASLRRYDALEDFVWEISFDGGNGGDNAAKDVTVDADGYIYATGFIDVEFESSNIWVGKYDSDGDEEWFETVNGSADSYDNGLSIAVDGDGNVYAAGLITETGEEANAWVRKYDPDGTKVWTHIYNNDDQNLEDEAHGIAVDAENNVYVTGMTMNGVSNADIWTRKLDVDGDEQWTVTEAGSADSADRGKAIAVGLDGALYGVGWLVTTAGGYDILVRRYDAQTGDEIWTDLEDIDSEELAYDVALDSAGNIYVVGEVDASGEGTNVWLRKYDPDGYWAE
ncbi:MAG: Ig-like domain-containing protein [Deltaproteobacteria bacterium]|nr:Ig-like domain-containing protein [Deltaproteobacteria bacterium]